MPIRWPWSRKQSSLDVLRSLFVAPAKSGVSITWQSALQASTVLACARVIAEGVAQVPFKLFRKRNGGGRESAEDHPLYALLHDRPNEWQTSFELREQLALHLVLTNNAFCYKNIVNGRIVEILPLEPGQVTVRRSQDWVLDYEIRMSDGRVMQVPAQSIWHIRGPSWNGYLGLDAVKLAREAIGLSLATEEHGARMFANGARVGGILSTDATLKKEQIAELREQWELTQGGGANAFRTAILHGGLKWTPTAMPSDEAQFLETRRFQVEEICRHFRVMPMMVGHTDKTSTYASAEQMFIAHVVHTLGPWYARIEQSANASLLSKEERSSGYYFKFIANGLLRGAVRDRGEFYARLFSVGALSPNEIRELEEMNPYDGGDQHRVPLNMERVRGGEDELS